MDLEVWSGGLLLFDLLSVDCVFLLVAPFAVFLSVGLLPVRLPVSLLAVVPVAFGLLIGCDCCVCCCGCCGGVDGDGGVMGWACCKNRRFFCTPFAMNNATVGRDVAGVENAITPSGNGERMAKERTVMAAKEDVMARCCMHFDEAMFVESGSVVLL